MMLSNKTNCLWIVGLWIMSTMITLPPASAKSSPVREDFVNWMDYLWKYPDYRAHQEPEDITVNGCQWGTWVTFPNKIIAIEAKIGPWEHPEALFGSQDFIAMYQHPDHYLSHCLAYLADHKPTIQQKKNCHLCHGVFIVRGMY